MNRLKRAVGKITVSEIYEWYQLKKLPNITISDENIDNGRQSAMIDILLNNYPTKAVFIQEKIGEQTNRRLFHFAKGKEKIEMIVQYIETNIQGNSLSHIFSSKEDADTFWSYSFSVEYIPSTLSEKEVDDILQWSEVW